MGVIYTDVVVTIVRAGNGVGIRRSRQRSETSGGTFLRASAAKITRTLVSPIVATVGRALARGRAQRYSVRISCMETVRPGRGKSNGMLPGARLGSRTSRFNTLRAPALSSHLSTNFSQRKLRSSVV